MSSPVLYIASVILGASGAVVVAFVGGRLGLIDSPTARSSHQIPTPKGGGIGILATFVLGSLVLRLPLAFWGPAVLLSLLGLVGDKVDISPKIRLLIQFAGATAVIIGTRGLRRTNWTGYLLMAVLPVYVVGTANFYNFMDGINGIAGITGLLGFGMLTAEPLVRGLSSPYSELGICLGLSCLGFLPFNVPRARVFMGDVGSILLGFAFAGMACTMAQTPTEFLALCGFLFPFYADELTTMPVRVRDGESLTKPHRRHLYQIMANQMQIPHWRVSAVFGLLQLIVGGVVLLVKPHGLLALMAVLLAFMAAFGAVSIYVRRRFEQNETPHQLRSE